MISFIFSIKFQLPTRNRNSIAYTNQNLLSWIILLATFSFNNFSRILTQQNLLKKYFIHSADMIRPDDFHGKPKVMMAWCVWVTYITFWLHTPQTSSLSPNCVLPHFTCFTYAVLLLPNLQPLSVCPLIHLCRSYKHFLSPFDELLLSTSSISSTGVDPQIKPPMDLAE